MKRFKDMYKISVGSTIYRLGDGKTYSWALTEKQNSYFLEEMKKIEEMPENKLGMRSKFNSYTYDITVVVPEIAKEPNDKWFTQYQMKDRLPLDASEERDQKLFEKAMKRARRIKENYEANELKVDCINVEKYYTDVHWRDNEFEEIRELVKAKFSNTNPHQSYRRLKEEVSESTLKDFKPVTLKSTGRKMLLNVSYYSWYFIEIDPVIK